MKLRQLFWKARASTENMSVAYFGTRKQSKIKKIRKH